MDLLEALLDVNPWWILMTVAGGLGVGFITREILLDKRTLFSLVTLILPFTLVRIFIFILFGPVISAGSGYIGSILFLVYLLTLYVGRKFGNKYF